jgi:hypothetical protein
MEINSFNVIGSEIKSKSLEKNLDESCGKTFDNSHKFYDEKN